MKKIHFIFLLIAILTISCQTANKVNKQADVKTAEAETDSNLEKINKIDSLIQKLIAEKKTAGFAFGIQIGDNKPITREYGFANLEKQIKVKSTDQFRIASLTKPVTATAILKLIELGKLSFDDTIDKFFPKYPNGQNISIYELLSHTSGIPDWWEGGIPENAPKNFPMCEKPHQYLQEMKKGSLFEPGTFYKYSNSGYILLGEIIEIVSGMSYDEFIKENIFEPSGMSNTEMEYIEKGSENWVKGYVLETENKIPFVDSEVYHMPFSAGGLRSNANDMLNFITALNSGRIINKKLFNQMTSYARLKNGKDVYEGNYIAPDSKPKKPQENIDKRGYGFGFEIMDLYKIPVIWHSGGIAGFNSVLMHIPQSNTSLILLANTEDGIIPELKEIRKIATEIESQK